MKQEEIVNKAVILEDGIGDTVSPGSQTVPTRRRTTNSFNNTKAESRSTDSEDAKKVSNVRTSPSAVGPVECPVASSHEGKEYINVVVPLPVDQVFTLLFVHLQFMIDVYNNKKTYDVVSNQWQTSSSGQEKKRQVTYTMGLPPNNLGPKVSYCTEDQTLLSQTVPGEAYVVETEVNNSGVPYADSFYVFNHYCLTRESETTTRLSVRALVKYKKSAWGLGLVKGQIEKNTYAGIEELLGEIALQLNQEAERGHGKGKSNGRRKRRKINNANEGKTTNNNVSNRQLQQKKDVSDVSSGGSHIGLIAVCLALIILGTANVILFYRLNNLDKMAQEAKNDELELPTLKYLGIGGSWEAVARILQKQEAFHEEQMETWKSIASQATTTLKQVEESIESVLTSIPEHRTNLLKHLEESAMEISKGGWTSHSHNTGLPLHLQVQHLQDKYNKLNQQNKVGENSVTESI